MEGGSGEDETGLTVGEGAIVAVVVAPAMSSKSYTGYAVAVLVMC